MKNGVVVGSVSALLFLLSTKALATPSPTITSPMANSTVSGLVTFACSNPGGTSNLYIDDLFIGNGSYQWNTTTVSNGGHYLVCNGYFKGVSNGERTETVLVSNGATPVPTSAPPPAPTARPTSAPTSAPTVAPTSAPTVAPTSVPTVA